MSKKNKIKKNISQGIVHIRCSFNNTIINITDTCGNTIFCSSAGCHNFTGSRQVTPHAAQVTVEYVCSKAKEIGLKTVSIKTRGLGPQREAAMRAVFVQGLLVTHIKDVTPIPHNGCRPPKRRRI